jgi:hypothetical protein
MTNLLTAAELAAERLRHREAVNNLAESLADVMRELAAERALADELATAMDTLGALLGDVAPSGAAICRAILVRYRAARGA